jgi:glycolate oxidase
VATILGHNILPCTLEYMDRTAIRLVSNLLTEDIPETVQAMLIIEIDGSRNQVAEQCERLTNLLKKHIHCKPQQATTEEEVERIWLARRSISPACFQLSASKTSEDVVVPRSKIPELVKFCEEMAQRLNITILTFGHAGDGNIHVNIMTCDQSATETEKAMEAKTALFKKVLSMEGTLSGEHGVGITKSAFIHMELDATSIKVMQQLKTLFDPKHILNPGKIFPENIAGQKSPFGS